MTVEWTFCETVDVDILFDLPVPVAARGRKNVEAALHGQKLKFQQKLLAKQSLALTRAQKKVNAALRQQDKLRGLLEDQELHRSRDQTSLLRRVLEFSEDRSYPAQPYPSDIRSFWIRIYTMSPYAFGHLTEVRNGTSLSAIKQWMKVEEGVLKNELLNPEHGTDIVRRWLDKWGGTDNIFTPSYDACKIDEDLPIGEQGRVVGTVKPVRLETEAVEYKTNMAFYQKLCEEQITKKKLVIHAVVFMLTPVSTAKRFPIFRALPETCNFARFFSAEYSWVSQCADN